MTENKLKSLIQEEIKVSMRKGDKEKTTTLRMAISEIKKEEMQYLKTSYYFIACLGFRLE